MKRTLVASLVAAATFVSAAAQETPETQLDFVRKLRAKGWHDLNKEYIDELIKVYPQLAGQLSLEQARSLVVLGRMKNLDQRATLFNQARDKFQTFVTEYAGKPEAVQARLELAKLVAYHGQAILSKALRDNEEPKDQHDAARRAEALFIQAGEELDAVIKELKGKELSQAKFERGVSYIDQARTYLDLDKVAIRRQRGELMLLAKKLFESMADDLTTEEGFLANAWLVKCGHELQEPKESTKRYHRVVNTTDKTGVAAAGQRLARYFHIQYIPKDIDLKLKPLERVKLIQTEANKWLKDFSGHHKSWEGQGVRFLLADAYLTEALFIAKDFKAPAAQGLLGQAQKLYSALAELDGEFSEESNRRSISIAVTKLEKIDLKDIRDFDNSLLKAYFELYSEVKKIDDKLADEKLKEPERKKLETARKQHLRDAVRALSQALNLATSSTPIVKVDEARWLLVTTLYRMNDRPRAFVAGKALAEARTKHSPQGAGLAILVIDELIKRDPCEANRQQLRNIVDYILSPESQKYWQADPVTGVARYQLAMLAHNDKNFATAIDNLELMPSDFGGFIYAQGQLVFIALAAADDKNNKLTEAERKQLRARARKAIQRMPNSLPADADPSTGRMYLLAQMEEPRILYREAAEDLRAQKLADAASKFKQMNKFIEQHYDAFKKSTVKFEDKTRKDLDTMMTVMQKYAKLGLADVEYRLGNYDKVLSFDLVGPLVQKLKEESKKEGKIRVKEHVVSAEILGLALRTYVQKDELESAEQIFKILERLAPENEADELTRDDSKFIFGVIADIEHHVQSIKGDAEKLKRAVAAYTKFIDAVAVSMLSKRPDIPDYIFLAKAYVTLEQPQKAADLYAKVPMPKITSLLTQETKKRELAKQSPLTNEEIKDRKSKLTKADLRENADYWYLRIQYCRALRENKEFKKAYAELEGAVTHPFGEHVILAEIEKNFVLEDSGILGRAIEGWNGAMKRLGERIAYDNDAKNKLLKRLDELGPQEVETKNLLLRRLDELTSQHGEIKRLYFDCYYYGTRARFKYSQSAKVIKDKKEDQYLNIAANMIFKLETSANPEGWELVGARLREFMDAEPKLKKMYDKLKKATPAK